MKMESNRVGMRITTRLVNEKYLTNLKGLMLSLASALNCMYAIPTRLVYCTLPGKYLLSIPKSSNVGRALVDLSWAPDRKKAGIFP